MPRFKALLLTAIGIAIVQNLPAQEHYNAWFRGTLSIPISPKTTTDNELQHRRQNGFENENIFDKNLMFTFRNWIHYQHNSAIKFSISPFAYFSNYKIIQKQLDENAEPNNEIRFSVALEFQNQLFSRFHIVNRTATEYRIFHHSTSNIIRVRNRLAFRYDFNERNKISVFDEVLLNADGATTTHFFDHHRIGFNLEHKISSHLKLDIGYVCIYRLPLTSSIKLKENNTVLNITYQLKKQKQTSNQ